MKRIIWSVNAVKASRWVSEQCASTLRRLLATSLLLTLSGMSGAAVAAELTIAVSRSPLSLLFFVAESRGYFAAEGVQVTLKEAIGGPRAMRMLADGKADLATSSDSVVMFNSFERNDFAVIATFATNKKDVNFIAGKALGDAHPKQLVGKRIGMVVASASHYFTDSWLIFHGVDPQLTRPVSLQPETMATALAKGEVDAVAIWDPYSFNILKTVPGTKLLPNPGIYNLSFNLIADRKLLGTRDDELASVLRALLRAEHDVQTEPGKAQAILRERLKLDQDFIDWMWPNINYRVSLMPSLLTTLESEARWARQEGHVTASRSPNYLNFIYREPLRKARPDRIGIGR